MDVKWHGQLHQDEWVARTFGVRPGVFLEAGAGDGVHMSNTLVLERTFGWTGLCVEPSSDFVALARQRTCKVDDSVLSDVSGKRVLFKQDEEHPYFNGIVDCMDAQKHRPGSNAERTTSSLEDVLSNKDMPQRIDYVSLDTEGSELFILRGFPFHTHSIGLLTVEHNGEEPKRTQIQDLLRHNGMRRVASVRWDDWYVNTDLGVAQFARAVAVSSHIRWTLGIGRIKHWVKMDLLGASGSLD
jgi:Methyltransferase FkbM domain